MQFLVQVLYICTSIVLVAAVRYAIHLLSTCYYLRHVPGPRTPSSLLWGEEWLLFHEIPGSCYIRWHKEFGNIVKFSGAFGHQVLSISDPQAVAYIIERIYRFPKPHGTRAWFQATIGEGLVWVEGKDAHEKMRKPLSAALSQQCIRKFTPIFYENAGKLSTQWFKQLDGSTSDEVEVEVTFWASRYALDTISSAAFSYDLNCLAGEPHALADALDGLTNSENSLSSFYMRALFWIFPSILAIGKKGEMIRLSKHELSKIALNIWKDAKAGSDDIGDRNVMAMMLRASEHNMSEDEVVSQMRTVISAGYETVSAVIAWILYEITQNPDLQSKLREEVYLADEASIDDFNAKFPFLDAVFCETLRLHTPVIEKHQEASETMSVPLSAPIPGSSEFRLVIPKGVRICIPLDVLHSNEEVWGSDTDKFRPERWMDRETEKGMYQRRHLLSFGDGPRSCIGKIFAQCEIKVLVVTLLRHFAFRASHYKIEPFQSLVVRPRITGQGPSSLPVLIRRI